MFSVYFGVVLELSGLMLWYEFVTWEPTLRRNEIKEAISSGVWLSIEAHFISFGDSSIPKIHYDLCVTYVYRVVSLVYVL